MALVKVKNNGQTVLYVESLGAIIRPFKTKADFILVDEEKAKVDAQFVKCIINGSVTVFTLDGKEWDVVKKDEEAPEKDKTVAKSTTKKSRVSKKTPKKQVEVAKVETLKKTNITIPMLEEEPKNSRPVVMDGKNPFRKSMEKNSDLPMPDFTDRKNKQFDEEDEYKDGDVRKDDIILT